MSISNCNLKHFHLLAPTYNLQPYFKNLLIPVTSAHFIDNNNSFPFTLGESN